MTTSSRRLDPDDLAYLEEQRNFLLRSLDDLERERDAGDIDDEEFAVLEADYTRRAADVLRAIDAGKARFAESARPRQRKRFALVGGGFLLAALLAGLVLAQASGFRGAGDVGSGDIRSSVLSLLAEADGHLAEGRNSEAIEVYDTVLEAQPSNAQALTYKGWLTNLDGDPEAALALVDQAVLADPEYPDARAFRVILLRRAGRLEDASIDLGAFDALSPPPGMQALLIDSGVRNEVIMHRIVTLADAGGAVTVAAIDATADETAIASRELLIVGSPIAALRGFVAAIDADPDNVVALTYRGRLVAETGDAESGLALVDQALAIDDTYPDAWLWKAAILFVAGRIDEAAEAFANVGPIDELPPELESAATDLASRLDAASG